MALLGVLPPAPVVLAQSPIEFNRINGYDDGSVPPFLVADRSGAVHAVTSQNLETGSISVLYRTFELHTGWSEPTDVILAPEGHRVSTVMGFVQDEQSRLHVIFHAAGSPNTAPAIYYSHAPIAKAANSQAWLSPIKVSPKARTLPAAAIGIGRGGNLRVLFSDDDFGQPVLMVVESADGGESWSAGSLVHETEDETLQPYNIQMVSDESGNTHAVWVVVGIDGNGESIQYSRYDSASRAWIDAIEIARQQPGQYETDWPALATVDGELLVVYNDGSPTTRWMRRSLDSGNTWSPPTRLYSHVGEYGYPRFATDSSGTLHMVLGNRTNAQIHGIWHSEYDGNQWSEPEPIVSGPLRTEGALYEIFDPTWPQITMILGTHLLVTWMTDWGAARNGVWSTLFEVGAEELPASLIPDPPTVEVSSSDRDVQGHRVPIVAATPTSTSTRSAQVDWSVAPERRAIPLILSLLATIVVLAGALVGMKSGSR